MIISLMEELKAEEDEVSQISAKIKMQAQKLEEAENISQITDVKEEIVKVIDDISYISETINNINVVIV